jgi:hypothetical protein
MWDPLGGTRRLLYDCVWLVSVNQFSANPASPVPPRAAEVSLLLRRLLANCTWVLSSALCKLCPSWLQITKAQGLGSGLTTESLCPWEFHHTLANLTSLSSEASRQARLEDSNLVDPASSHTLVSKTKPCMSKYKCYTMKLRMAH